MSGDEAPRAVLLDTCAVIWLANGEQLSPESRATIIFAGLADGVFVSPISAWEVGLLSKPRPGRGPALSFLPDPKSWFSRFMSSPLIKTAHFTPEIAVDASFLPGNLHGDPGDRIIIATSRHLGIPVMTRDAKIIAYAAAGHARVIAC